MKPVINGVYLNQVDHAGSPDRFGYEWARYAELLPVHEQQFRGWTTPLLPEDWVGATFLDVGCGMGRNSYWPMSYGAAGGLAIDPDERCVRATRHLLRDFANAETRQLSVYELDYTDQFDICFSIGVIHHLQNPGDAVRMMARAAKPGGRVLIWVYGFENNEWIVRYVDPVRRSILARIPVGLLHHLSLYPALALWLAVRLARGRTAYWKLLRTMGFRQLRSIVFDQLLPRIAHYWPRAEVERLIVEADLELVELRWVNQMSWTAIGVKKDVVQ